MVRRLPWPDRLRKSDRLDSERHNDAARRLGLSLEADWSSSRCNECSAGVPDARYHRAGARAVGGSVFTEILREEMQRTFEHAERYGWGV